MKNNILSDFYLGNIVPGEKSFKRNSEYGRAASKMCEAHETLHSMLNGDMLQFLNDFTDAQMHVDAIAVRESYIDGFKTGVRFMLAILDDDYGDLLPVGEKD